MEEQLYNACKNGDLNTVKTLLESNPNIDINWVNTDRYSYTALHIACSNDRVEIAQLLLSHPGVNPNLKTSNGKSCFHLACSHNLKPIVQMMLENTIISVNKMSNDGNTALSEATRLGYVDVIKLLIASGRDLFLGDKGTMSDVFGNRTVGVNLRTTCLLERFKQDPDRTRREIADNSINDILSSLEADMAQDDSDSDSDNDEE
jgi:ankyrin repeat protein